MQLEEHTDLSFDALYNRANAWARLGQRDKALADYLHYVLERSNDPDGYARLAEMLELRDHGEDSWAGIVAACGWHLDRTPANLDALNRCALLLGKFHCYEAAHAIFDDLRELAPENLALLGNIAYLLRAQNRIDEALACYHDALALAPDDAASNFGKSICHLLRGDYEQGWLGYEWRWKTTDGPRQTVFDKPRWLGRRDICGKTILLHPEQGLGDAVQFSRYASLVAAKGARVILAAHAPLLEVMRGIEGVDMLVEFGKELPPFDCHCPLMSLPLALGTTLATIPEPARLSVDPVRKLAWEKRLGPRGRPRVGLVWSGNAEYVNDERRSIPLETLGPLLDLPMEFHALQVELRAEDAAALAAAGNLRWHGAEVLQSFADTAALIDAMDCVITVDTAVAHVAGSLGKPVWIMLPFRPDFRWLLHRSDSPWYPSACLFRQTTPGDWGGVVQQVAQALRAEAEG